MLKRAQRRCKICRAKFTPTCENHRWCCPEHGAEFAMQELEKKREKLARAKAKKERAEWRKRKAAVKPLRLDESDDVMLNVVVDKAELLLHASPPERLNAECRKSPVAFAISDRDCCKVLCAMCPHLAPDNRVSCSS